MNMEHMAIHLRAAPLSPLSGHTRSVQVTCVILFFHKYPFSIDTALVQRHQPSGNHSRHHTQDKVLCRRNQKTVNYHQFPAYRHMDHIITDHIKIYHSAQIVRHHAPKGRKSRQATPPRTLPAQLSCNPGRSHKADQNQR